MIVACQPIMLQYSDYIWPLSQFHTSQLNVSCILLDIMSEAFSGCVLTSVVTAFDQDQHIGPSDRFVDDTLVCKPAPIVS